MNVHELQRDQLTELKQRYLCENGDPSGLTEEEVEEIDEWLHDNFPRGYVCEYHDDETFTRKPLWGLACNTTTVDFYEP